MSGLEKQATEVVKDSIQQGSNVDMDSFIGKWIQKGIDWVSKFSPELGEKIAGIMGWSKEEQNKLIAEVEGNEDVQNYVEMASALNVNVDAQIKKRLSNLGQPFIGKLKVICDRNGWNPNDLLRVMNAESRLDPNAVNSTSGAFGLIQCMPKTAAKLGTSIASMKKMTPLQQLDIVEKYYQTNSGGRSLSSVQDMYLVTFFPRAIGRGPDYIFSSPKENLSAEIITKQNPAIARFSTRSDGLIDGKAFEAYVDSIA